jgi:adenosylcobinamide kinase/adenosylcobinamide-phosphate guanylyltransferase
MTDNQIHLIIGGCRSGKSRHALEMAETMIGSCNVFVATCMPADQEMEARVRRHQQERGRKWTTIEEPLDIAGVIEKYGSSYDTAVILVDCLTLWVSNLMARHEDDDKVMEQIRNTCLSLDSSVCPVLMVSNEVGAGIVPENAMARRFRDLAGFANQHMAKSAGAVTWMVAGIPVKIK